MYRFQIFNILVGMSLMLLFFVYIEKEMPLRLASNIFLIIWKNDTKWKVRESMGLFWLQFSAETFGDGNQLSGAGYIQSYRHVEI